MLISTVALVLHGVSVVVQVTTAGEVEWELCIGTIRWWDGNKCFVSEQDVFVDTSAAPIVEGFEDGSVLYLSVGRTDETGPLESLISPLYAGSLKVALDTLVPAVVLRCSVSCGDGMEQVRLWLDGKEQENAQLTVNAAVTGRRGNGKLTNPEGWQVCAALPIERCDVVRFVRWRAELDE
jgi:hypothetical protein